MLFELTPKARYLRRGTLSVVRAIDCSRPRCRPMGGVETLTYGYCVYEQKEVECFFLSVRDNGSQGPRPAPFSVVPGAQRNLHKGSPDGYGLAEPAGSAEQLIDGFALAEPRFGWHDPMLDRARLGVRRLGRKGAPGAMCGTASAVEHLSIKTNMTSGMTSWMGHKGHPAWDFHF
jgi:hypothetical protein